MDFHSDGPGMKVFGPYINTGRLNWSLLTIQQVVSSSVFSGRLTTH